VQSRVKLGGHSVPTGKIKSRYKKSLHLLAEAIKLVDRAFIYDNSEQYKTILLAEKEEEEIRIFEPKVPQWFDAFLIKKLS
jgi:predicted ABC-type ATPase